MKLVFGLQVQLIQSKCWGTTRLCVVLCVSTCFLCLLTEQTQSNSPSAALMTPEKWQHYHWRTHTLSSSQSFAPIGTKALRGETERGDDNSQCGKSKVLGVVAKTRGGD